MNFQDPYAGLSPIGRHALTSTLPDLRTNPSIANLSRQAMLISKILDEIAKRRVNKRLTADELCLAWEDP